MGDNSIVVGVFKQEVRAESAIDVLREVGFNNDQIGYAGHTNKGGMKRILEYMVTVGLPEEEISYYESEYESGRSIVLVKHDGRRGETLAILLLNGARNHKYLKMGEQASKEQSSTFVSASTGLHNQLEASQHSPSDSSTKAAATYDSEPLTGDEMASLRRLLEREGLDHLL
jgi:hypothetical protein